MSRWFLIGAILAALAVLAGALGEHVMREKLSAETFDFYRTAAQYQMYHSIGLMLLGLAVGGRNSGGASLRYWPIVAGWAFLLGIALFCGGLYARAVGDIHLPWPVIPSGGLLFVVGWLALAVAACKSAANAGPQHTSPKR